MVLLQVDWDKFCKNSNTYRHIFKITDSSSDTSPPSIIAKLFFGTNRD